MNKSHRLAACSLLAVSLTGCAIPNSYEREARVDDSQQQAVELMEFQRHQAEASQRSFVRIRDKQWVDTTAIIQTRRRLPDSVNCRVSYIPYATSGVYELTQTVQKSCGISVRLTEDAVSYLIGDSEQEEGAAASGGGGYQGGMMTGSEADAILVQALTGGEEKLGERRINNLSWEDEPLENVLSGVASSLGLSWEYKAEKGEVQLYHTQTETFAIQGIPSTTAMSSSVNSGASSDMGATGEGVTSAAEGSAESSQETTVTLEHNFAEDLKATVESILSENGRYNYSASTGKLTVTDTPPVLSRVARYVDQENKSLTQQILINMKILSVTLDDTDSLSIDWDLVYSGMGSDIAGGLEGAVSSVVENAGSGSIQIIDAESRFQNSQLMFNALSEQGRVSTLTSPSLTTTNMQPVPVQVARQIGYIAEREVVVSEGGQTTTSQRQATVTEGLNMTMLPYVINKDELLLQYSLSLTDLRDLRSAGSEDNAIEIPEIGTRMFSQRVKLKDGETLVLSGFDQETNRTDRSGIGHAENLITGGSVSSGTQREVIVILITPIFMG
ncbi:PilN family type IVB pilus formation outer membrane protein [Halomonas elongata]|uniref:PilN family type IVB pilus formation outer membrane protein n=1 Tax=Halomonas elongata TaxID=2746 RepID=UPI00255B30B3|nr:PilN family type IVB pilus formation outer membrane protein [Halomonas elongata]MDL4860765.1 PilN family type IVB pilus formation outer membrane protein [Halomonas elongata]